MPKGRRGHRYTAEQKQRILAAAKKEGLTGEQVKKRFGVSTLTFYRWRGPVRGRRGRSAAARARGNGVRVNRDVLRGEVRSGIAQVLPGVIREEVSRALADLLGRRGPGRPRKA
jgi:transposase-like protein